MQSLIQRKLGSYNDIKGHFKENSITGNKESLQNKSKVVQFTRKRWENDMKSKYKQQFTEWQEVVVDKSTNTVKIVNASLSPDRNKRGEKSVGKLEISTVE